MHIMDKRIKDNIMNKLNCNLEINFLDSNKIFKCLENKKILITGATGLIGRYLVEVLCNKILVSDINYDIYILSRSEINVSEKFADYINKPFFHVILQDIKEPLNVNIKFDFIINAASNAHPLVYAEDPVGTITGNIIGLYNILNYAKNNGCQRIIEFSSNEIYGIKENKSYIFTEKDYGIIDCNKLRAGYPESKRVCEALCQAFKEKYNLDIIIMRPARIYGPTMNFEDSKATAQFIKNILQGENIVLKSSGEQIFSYAYVGDVVTATLFLLCKGESGEAYNVADKNSTIKLKKLAEIAANIGNSKVIYDLPNKTELKGFSNSPGMVLDCTKLESLGWQSYTNINEGIRKTVDILNNIKKA